MKARYIILLFFLLLRTQVEAESFRVFVAAEAGLSPDKPEGESVSLFYADSAIIRLNGDIRFFRGIQLDLTAPAGFFTYRGSLALVLYNELDGVLEPGVADINGRQLYLEALPNKILNTWQIPLRAAHGLRSSPYVTIPTSAISPSSFPMLFRLMPVIKGISEELEKMVFHLQIRPILGDEGVVRIGFRFPEQLPDRPVTMLIDDELIDSQDGEILLKEGEHHLVILSEDYRNQSRRFLVERAKYLDLLVELQDLTPLLVFEYPEGARIYVDNQEVDSPETPYPVEPGPHEIRFQMSNYSIIRPLAVQKGKTYRIALSVDINITEND